MPEEDDLTPEELEEQLPNPARKRMRGLEKELREAKAREETGEAAKRELAALKAGIDLASPLGELFVAGYKGEWTADEVKAAATKYGIVQPKPEPAEDAALEARRQQAAAAQANIGDSPFLESLPRGAQTDQQGMIDEMREAVSKVSGSDSRPYIEAIRGVYHSHGMVFSDEID